MSTGGFEFLVLVIGALSLFAGVLAWACTMEWLEKRRAAVTAEAVTQKIEQPWREAA